MSSFDPDRPARRALPRIAAATFVAAALASASVAAGRPIGFRVMELTDGSRSTDVYPRGRPVQVVVWYPAAAGAGPPVHYVDYVRLAAAETRFGRVSEADSHDALADYRSFLSGAGVPEPETGRWLETKMHATFDAAPADGLFPLVLIAQGNGQSAHDQAFLSELLATRGYVVATTPSPSRIDGPMQSEEQIPGYAEAQAADLELAARALRGEHFVRRGRYGVIGHSFGARSALLLSMRDPEVALVVSLDGGIGGKAGKGRLETAAGFDRRRATAPLLHLYEEGDRFMIPDLDLLRSLPGSRWLVRVDGMHHVHFSSTGVLAASVPSVARATGATSRTTAGWKEVAEATASFLDRFLRATPQVGVRWSPPRSSLLHTVALGPNDRAD